MEQLYVFGTGNAAATRYYNTCFALKKGQEYFMVDAGGGNGIIRILNDMNVDLTHIHNLYVSHAHTDHILGVIWMVRVIGTRMKSGMYEGELNIYCHKNLTTVVDTLCKLTLQKKFYDLIGDKIHLISISDGESRSILGCDVTFFDIHSNKMEQYGFTMALNDNKKLTFCGDEPLHPLCEKYAKSCDWLLHEAFCLYEERDIFKPYEKHHSTVKDSCKRANQLLVNHLILWHTEDSHGNHRKDLYLKEGTPYFTGKLEIPEDGEIIQL